MVALKPDVLRIIFGYLQNPLPPRHAAAKVRPARASIRQNDLCALIRVNKEFYELAAPLLYRRAVTDNFILFLVGLHEPVISGITSKAELLASTRHLYIEYSAKEESPEVTYQDLFDYQIFDLLGDGEAERLKRRDFQGVKELFLFQAAWRILLEKSGKQRRVFNSLETLATGAIFGQQEEIWRSIGLRFDEWTQLVFMTQRLTLNFLCGTPSIRHYCQAGSTGPLNVGVTLIGDLNQNRPTIACHNDYHDPTLLPISIGVRSRWYVHLDPADPRVKEVAVAGWARMNVEDALRNRLQFAMDEAWARTVPDWGLVGGVYRHYPQKAGANAYRLTTASTLDKFRQRLPKWVKAKDDWETKPLSQAPRCDGCGWSP